MEIKFGTDGWRGIIGDDFTFSNVRRCAQGTALFFKEGPLVVGCDRRFLSEEFAKAVCEVLAGNGIKVLFCPEPVPTPVLSFGIRGKAKGGVVITASHNPYMWNGFKVKNRHGGSAQKSITDEIEKLIPPSEKDVKRIPFNTALDKGLIQIYNPTHEYFEHICSIVDIELIKRSGIKVCADYMYGVASGYLGRILDACEIHTERNPLFPGIQPEPCLLYTSPSPRD